MKIYKNQSHIANEPRFEKKAVSIVRSVPVGGALAVLDASEVESGLGWSDAQRKWWKGQLLPSLAACTGNTVDWWETRLKLQVMPDEFQPITTVIDGEEHTHLESIKKLTREQMTEMVTGSVAHLRDETIYGKIFQWVVWPNPDKKKE